jgi:hypothetical protein
MRQRTRFPVLLLVAVMGVALAACDGRNTVLDDETRARAVERGDSAVNVLVESLVGELQAALAAGGPPGAIDFCASRAQEITAEAAARMGPGWEFKRATLRPRNPVNEPDALELEALEFFHAAEVADQDIPTSYVQRTPDGDYRYYRPLMVVPMCVACHGPADRLHPDVQAILLERYPDDQATGYEPGDLRGVVRATIPAEVVEP